MYCIYGVDQNSFNPEPGNGRSSPTTNLAKLSPFLALSVRSIVQWKLLELEG